MIFYQWKGKDKFGSNTFRTHYIDIFTVCLNDLFYDRKAKSGTFLILSAGKVCFIKTFPDFFDTVFRNTNTTVFYRNKNFFIFSVVSILMTESL